jgi:hypothetical protein
LTQRYFTGKCDRYFLSQQPQRFNHSEPSKSESPKSDQLVVVNNHSSQWLQFVLLVEETAKPYHLSPFRKLWKSAAASVD